MKLFIVAAILVASVFAEPEPESKSEPWLHYGAYAGYPYATGYTGYALGAPTAYTYRSGLYAPYAHGAYYGGAHLLGKREAEAEPEPKSEAEPWLSTYGAYPAYTGYGYGLGSRVVGLAGPATHGYASGYPYTSAYHYGGLGGYGYGLYGRKKREADSEADPKSYYATYGYPSYGGYAGYGGLYGGYAGYGGLGYRAYGGLGYAGYGRGLYGYYG